MITKIIYPNKIRPGYVARTNDTNTIIYIYYCNSISVFSQTNLLNVNRIAEFKVKQWKKL